MDNSWKELGGELKYRLFEPAKHVSFVCYFLVASVVAAAGVWFALIPISEVSGDNTDASRKLFYALLTYFPAIGSIACLQVIVVEDARKYLRSIFVLLLILFIGLTVVAGFLYTQQTKTSWIIVITSTGIALLAWWISIGREEGLRDQTNAKDALGGDSSSAPAGSSSDFKI